MYLRPITRLFASGVGGSGVGSWPNPSSDLVDLYGKNVKSNQSVNQLSEFQIPLNRRFIGSILYPNTNIYIIQILYKNVWAITIYHLKTTPA